VANLAGIAGRIVWGMLADRAAPARLLLAWLGFGMAICCLLTAAMEPGAPVAWLFIVVALFGATAIGWNGVYLSEVARRAPAGSAGLATGATLFFTYAGVLVGPPVFGTLAAVSSYAKAYAALAVVGAICGIWLAQAWKPQHQSE
jgi:MFS family permease